MTSSAESALARGSACNGMKVPRSCVSSFVEPAVLLLNYRPCILPHDLFSHLFNFTSLIIVIRSCSRCMGRGVVLAFDSSSDPILFSSSRCLDDLEQRTNHHARDLPFIPSNHTSILYRATQNDSRFRSLSSSDIRLKLDISRSKLRLSCSCSRLASTNCPAGLPHNLLAYYNRFLFPGTPASFRLSLNQ